MSRANMTVAQQGRKSICPSNCHGNLSILLHTHPLPKKIFAFFKKIYSTILLFSENMIEWSSSVDHSWLHIP